MTIHERYFAYLDKFSNTVSLSALFESPADNLIGLRHDVDHDLDVALELAYHEYKRGFRASYFILHDHAYNQDPMFLQKLLQLQDYGHEVGVHCNLIAGWLNHTFDDPVSHFTEWLDNARAAGLEIKGTATHGDALCYQHNVINNWFFKQQVKRRDNYSPLSAEGVIDPTCNRNIGYPEEPLIQRSDGASLNLWSQDMQQFGLEYEAVDIAAYYWSDTGKDWHRTGDPIDKDLSQGRHQVLMHPIHWRAEPRKIFFVSSARVGSKWTANAIDTCTSAKVVHEWTLNHRQRNAKHAQEKITTFDTQALEKNRAYADKLIQYSSRFHANDSADYIEFNVYLVDYLPEILEAFPNAEIYGLVRDGKKVIASLLSRAWYASASSPRYPYSDRYTDSKLTQFERVCQYWVDVNETVLDTSKSIYKIELLAKHPQSFTDFLEQLSLPAHQRLIDALDFSPKDQTASLKGYDVQNWSASQHMCFAQICGNLSSRLGYARLSDEIRSKVYAISNKFFGKPQTITGYQESSPTIHDLREWKWSFSKVGVVHDTSSAAVTFTTDGKPGWVMIDSNINTNLAPSWNNIGDGQGLELVEGGTQVDGLIKFTSDSEQIIRLFLLEYDASSGQLVHKKVLTQLISGWRGVFSEVISATPNKICLAIYISPASPEKEELESKASITISKFTLKLSALNNSYRM